MEIELDKITSTEALIKIKLKENDYQPKVDEKIKNYSRKANLKGFRPGKVPIPVIRKMFGKAILAEEINELLSSKLNDYIRENDLPILSDPIPNREKSGTIDWENQKEFEFEYNIGMAGDFELKPEKISAIRYNIKVNDKVVDQTIDNLRKQNGQMINPEISEEGDILFGDFTHLATETTHTHALDLGKVEKKERKKFIGVKKGQKVIFEMKKAIRNAHDAAHLIGVSEEEYKKMKGDFELVIKNINQQIPAELDQELFDKVYGKEVVTDEPAFKAKIENSVKENYRNESESYLEGSIQKLLLEKTKIELPETFLKNRLYESAKNDEKLTASDVDNYFAEYLKDVKWSLIQNRLAKDHQVKVEQNEVIEAAKDLIRQQFGSSPQVIEQLEPNMDQFANNYLGAEDGKNYRQLYNRLIVEKIFKLLKEKVSIKEKSISADDFGKLSL